MESAAFWAWVFGLSSLASLVFAVYIYFRSREHIYPLIEKLRASRNNLRHLELNLNRIISIAELKEIPAEEKVRMMRQVARAVGEGIHTCMNTIDDGVNWGEKSVKQIYEVL